MAREHLSNQFQKAVLSPRATHNREAANLAAANLMASNLGAKIR